MTVRSRVGFAGCAALALLGCIQSGASATPELAVLRLELAECSTENQHRATAFLVGDDLAFTVAHAFDNIGSFVVRSSSGELTEAEVVYLDTDRDIALIRLASSASPSLALINPDENTSVSVISFADVDGPVVKDAQILRFVRLTLDGVGDRAGIEVAADIQSGDSGGPIVDRDGRVLGMVFATARQGERGWAVAASELETALDEVSEEPIDLPCEPRP